MGSVNELTGDPVGSNDGETNHNVFHYSGRKGRLTRGGTGAMAKAVRRQSGHDLIF